MSLPVIKYCPGTLAKGYRTYSRTCLNRVFKGRSVYHVLPYNAPAVDEKTDELYFENQKHISISGVQVKYSLLIEKNHLRLTKEGEQGTYILKPIPSGVKIAGAMPANEHLTMQIARQVFDIETAENAMIFFKDGSPAYITKRFDVDENEEKLAKEDFASLAGRTPQTHGDKYKYLGCYSELFELLKKRLPAYKPTALKLYKLIVFNYLFSNGDAHLKNFSLIETPDGDFRLSPAYDLLNSQLHIDDSEFALKDGLLPKQLAKGKVKEQFYLLAEKAGLSEKQTSEIFSDMHAGSEKVALLTKTSYLSENSKRTYLQAYQTRYKKLYRK